MLDISHQVCDVVSVKQRKSVDMIPKDLIEHQFRYAVESAVYSRELDADEVGDAERNEQR